MRNKMARAFIVGLLLLASGARGTTTLPELGPPALLSKVADKHLIDVYVTPPRASSTYKPGKIEVYLVRMFPDHLIVELIQTRIGGAQVRVHFAVQPEHQSKYYIRVSDLQPNGRRLLLNEDALTKIPVHSSK